MSSVYDVFSKMVCRICGAKPAERNPFKSRCEEHDVCDRCRKTRDEVKHFVVKLSINEQYCDECHEAIVDEMVEKYTSEHPNPLAEAHAEDNVVCPWCGHSVHISDFSRLNFDEYTCGQCERIYTIEDHYEVVYVQTNRVELEQKKP